MLVRGLAYLPPEWLHPATEGSKSRDPQPNIRHCSGNPMEKVEEGVEETKGSWTPQEESSQNQLSWTHSDSQRLELQAGSWYGSHRGPSHISYSCVDCCS